MSEASSAKRQFGSKQDSSPSHDAFLQVYEELRRIAKAYLKDQSPGHTLQTTALVHEAFLKLRRKSDVDDRGHFLHMAAEAMRQILVDHARAKRRNKRGGGKILHRQLEDVAVLAVDPDSETMMALEDALCRLEISNPRAAEVTKLRFFAGLSVEQTATATGLSSSTVSRLWRFARAWLFDAMESNSRQEPGSGQDEPASG